MAHAKVGSSAVCWGTIAPGRSMWGYVAVMVNRIATVLTALTVAFWAAAPALAQEDDAATLTEAAKTDSAVPMKVELKGPYVLIDAASGEVLAQDRAGEPWYPASLTKLMTGFIVFQKIREGKLRLDQLVPVSKRAASQIPSKLGAPQGTMLTVDFALQAMLVYSANDMAYVLAEAAGGSVEEFAKEMNHVARNLGMTASHFVNPNGLFDARQITSARDMAVLSAVLLAEFPEHAHYFDQRAVQHGKKELLNRNRLIHAMPEADGMKTGFVCASGFNLVASATREGRRMISVVLGYKNSFTRAEAARMLINLGFSGEAKPSGVTIGELVNLPQGAIVPSDMTPTTCKGKQPFTVYDGAEVAGWGITFGTYDTSQKADMALRGRLLNPIGVDIDAPSGVIKLPQKSGFGAVVWGLDALTSRTLCDEYKADGAYCDVVSDTVMAKIAAVAQARKASVAVTKDVPDQSDEPNVLAGEGDPPPKTR